MSVQPALGGRVDEVAAKFSKAEDLLAGGLVTFGIFMLAAFINLLIWGVFPFAVSVIVGFIICLPIVIGGLVRVDRLRRLLDPQEDLGRLSLDQSAGARVELPAARVTDRLDSRLPLPGSVTEHTTLSLKDTGAKS